MPPRSQAISRLMRPRNGGAPPPPPPPPEEPMLPPSDPRTPRTAAAEPPMMPTEGTPSGEMGGGDPEHSYEQGMTALQHLSEIWPKFTPVLEQFTQVWDEYQKGGEGGERGPTPGAVKTPGEASKEGGPPMGPLEAMGGRRV